MAAESRVQIAEQPILSTRDIVTYNAQTHEIEITTDAFARLAELEVPVQGRSFMVCVDRAPVYWGAFWTPVSSMSFDGVTIWKPPAHRQPAVIALELGYPSPDFYSGEDPRNKTALMEALKRTGKLIDRLSLDRVDELPRSFKGYELYSWEEEGSWHFRLITGTNRTKTIEEITSEGDYVSRSGWVSIHVIGTEAIMGVLGKLPSGEHVSWSGELPTGQNTGTNLRLPPDQITGAIKVYAEGKGLDLAVTVP
jgi:hypothetical protein